MTAPLELNSAIIRNHLNCASIEVSEGRMTIIFRSKESAQAFNEIFEASWKADQIMSEHCSPYTPNGFDSWKEYAKMIGTPQFSAYAVKIDDEFTTSTLAAKIAALYQ